MKTLIIAEAGVNHNGCIKLAKKMIDEAKKAGVDYVKFQTFTPESLVSKRADKAEYQKKETGSEENQLDMIRRLALSHDDFIELSVYCRQVDIKFLSTAFDLDSVEFLCDLNMSAWKIPSGEITNLPYLIKIASFNMPIILSTGMSNMQEVKDAVAVLKENGSGEITILHCTTEYPAPYVDVNLRAIEMIRNEIGVSVGYSDHTEGIEVSIAAVALGAKIIEKHFTLDKKMQGPDHKASLEPHELSDMVKAIRNIEKAMGSGEKVVSPSERKNIDVARKSIVAKCNITKGDVFTEKNIAAKRPGNGVSPMRWFEVLGTYAIRDFEEDELIEL
ncbi:MAG: N-acetylneuraminate synthase [Oscillospiraceae bacterium]|nr:N-acetylneuraminate synthase [Oscillospiraceae bacterium]